MSEYFYNRDRNITGIQLLTGVGSPTYGSSASFTVKNNEFLYPGQIKRSMASCLNSLVGEYSLIFRTREEEAQQIINYFESRSGVLPAVVADESSIYHPISGFVDEFSWAAKTNAEYELTTKIVVDNVSSQLNWSGLAFANVPLVSWTTGESIGKYDVRYFEFDSADKTNNFFYCTGDHISSAANSPFSTGSMWTQELFYLENIDYSIADQPSVGRIDFSSSFPQRLKTDKNIHAVKRLTLKFDKISDKQTSSILHFVESKFGNKKFAYQIPKIYNRPKLFSCPSWRHSWLYKNSNSVEIDLVEDPLGIISSEVSPSISLVQNAGWSSLNYNVDSIQDSSVWNFGSGNQVVTDGYHSQVWTQTGANSAMGYGLISDFSSTNQRINYFELNSRAKVSSINISGNLATDIRLNKNKFLRHLNLSNNSLGELSLTGMTGLLSCHLENNSLEELSVYSCSNLTGLYLSGNSLSYSELSGVLNDLVNNGQYSGSLQATDGSYPNSNDPIQGASIVDAATLGWRGWDVGFDNVELPFIPTSKVFWYQQESITGYQNGQGIFQWTDSQNNVSASQFTVIDSLRPTYLTNQYGARPKLLFNWQASLYATGNGIVLNEPFSIFGAIEYSSNDVMSIVSDMSGIGVFVSGGNLSVKNPSDSSLKSLGALNTGLNIFGVSFFNGGISGSINSLSLNSGVSTSTSAFNSSLYIGASTGGQYLKGAISELIISSGVVNHSDMMYGLGIKHGTQLT